MLGRVWRVKSSAQSISTKTFKRRISSSPRRFWGCNHCTGRTAFRGRAGRVRSRRFQSAQLRDQQASAAFSHVLSRAFSEDVSQTQRYARIEALDRVFASQNSEDWQTANQHAKQFMDKAQVDAAHASKVRGAILAQMSGQAGAEATAQLLAPLAGTKLGGGGKLNLSGKAQGTTESAKEDQQTMSMAT